MATRGSIPDDEGEGKGAREGRVLGRGVCGAGGARVGSASDGECTGKSALKGVFRVWSVPCRECCRARSVLGRGVRGGRKSSCTVRVSGGEVYGNRG